MIYYLHGQPGSGKTTLGTKLHKFIKTEKRNWRKSVFHIDSDGLRELSQNTDLTDDGIKLNILNTHMIVEYLHNNGCDVVISIVSPHLSLREEFKDKFADGDYQEIYLHTIEKRSKDDYKVDDYEEPEINFIDMDTTKDNPDKSFSKLINLLHKLKKIE